MKNFRWLLLLVLSIVFLVGCGTNTVVRTVTSPDVPITPKPGAVAPPAHQAPNCDPKELAEIEAGKGEPGSCAPKSNPEVSSPNTVTPKLVTSKIALMAAVRRQTCLDVSNNNPIFNWHPVKAHGHLCGYLKIIQGTRYIDITAAGMANAQRAAGIIPGSYDFFEVCRTSASGEARLYASRLKAIGLINHAFVPMGDAEWPLNAPCSVSTARAWLTTWQNTVHALIHRWPGFYTGAWWWNPNVGCWRPPHALRWVSGYTSRKNLSIPCGWGGVDLWQYTDNGYNGVSKSDISQLEISATQFGQISAPVLTLKQKRTQKLKSLHIHKRERAELYRDINNHLCRPGQHNLPREPKRLRNKYHSLCGRWIKRGNEVVKTINRYLFELHIIRN